MTATRTCLLLTLAALFAGCTPKPVATAPANLCQTADLNVSLSIPRMQVATGQKFDVTVTAVNPTRQPVVINATSGAPVYVRIYRWTGLAWDEIKRYPQCATCLVTAWTLNAGESRSFTMQLTVEPDWPTSEQLLMTAELNGRPDCAPRLTFEVASPVRR